MRPDRQGTQTKMALHGIARERLRSGWSNDNPYLIYRRGESRLAARLKTIAIAHELLLAELIQSA